MLSVWILQGHEQQSILGIVFGEYSAKFWRHEVWSRAESSQSSKVTGKWLPVHELFIIFFIFNYFNICYNYKIKCNTWLCNWTYPAWHCLFLTWAWCVREKFGIYVCIDHWGRHITTIHEIMKPEMWITCKAINISVHLTLENINLQFKPYNMKQRGISWIN